MIKHTPGPWVIGKKSKQKQRIDIDAPMGDEDLVHLEWRGLCRVYGCDAMPELGFKKAEANARLIKAAPDLLAALQAVVAAADGNGWEDLHPSLADQRAAIAKATGSDQ